MAEAFLGEIRMFGGTFAPRNWALCNGQLLSIAQNSALFSLLGTAYGGNGTTTFGLPDLRGRSPLGPGQGPNTSSYTIGQTGGSENVSLTINNLPAHTHTATAAINAGGRADAASPDGAVPGDTGATSIYSSAPDGTTKMNAGAVAVTLSPAGASSPVNIVPPFACVNYIICTAGIFPSRP